MRTFLAVFLALLLTACAAEAPNVAQQSPAIRCAKEFPTGSNLPVTRCRSEDDLERERQETREAAERLGRPQGRAIGAGGGP